MSARSSRSSSTGRIPLLEARRRRWKYFPGSLTALTYSLWNRFLPRGVEANTHQPFLSDRAGRMIWEKTDGLNRAYSSPTPPSRYIPLRESGLSDPRQYIVRSPCNVTFSSDWLGGREKYFSP